MGNIKIKTLEASPLTIDSLEQKHLYKDIDFDLEPAYSFNNKLNKKEFQKDIQALFDVEAVKNSIVTAFLTAPGQKILNPTYGIDLKRYLFEPVDDFTADIIQDDIQNKLPRMEPRITIENVTVIGDEDAQQYDINLQINIPSLNQYGISIKSELSTSGYTIL